MEEDIIKLKIRCSSETCKKLREEGWFFETIAEALDIDREEIEEIIEEDNKEKNN